MPRSQRLRPGPLRSAPMAEWLEPRLLFSADLAGAFQLGMDAADAAVEQRTLDTNGEYAAETAALGTAAAVATNYAATTLTFEVNEGQAAQGVDFIAYGGGYGISLQGGNAALTLLTDSGQRTVQLELAGDARSAEAEGQAQLQTQSNYVIGNDPSAWQTGIANYGAVVYRGVYEGIDVRYYGNQRQLEYDFIVAAGADPSAISLRFEGVSTASIAENGDLVLRVEGTDSDVRFRAPVSYQQGPDGLEEVASRYEIRADGSIGFVVGNYDRTRELVIDPVLDYATYFGTSGSERAPAIAVDAAGNVYITGRTTSNNPPLADLQGAGGGAGDIYVAKFSPDLSTLLFSTRIGGSGDEQGNAIAVDAAGNIAVTGWTQSGDFPVQSAADSSLSGAQDTVIFKLNASGGLVFSTYFGGDSTGDSGNAIAMDSAGSVYVAGRASDSGLLPQALQLLFGSSDNVFINKYDAVGGVVYQELFGGSSTDVATDIALGSGGDVYVVGNTQSSNWSSSGGEDGSLGGAIDGFLLHLDASGNPTYSTYIGASDADTVTGVATDGIGKAYVVGVTRTGPSVTFPTTAGAFQTTTATSNADTGFLRIYDTNQTGAASLVYSSYLGGSSSDLPTDVAYASGRVVVAGQASSTDFPITTDAVQSTHTGSPMYLAVINPTGAGEADLHYGTYYAGDMVSVGDVAVSGNHVYVSGEITSSGWATTGANQTANQGSDAFIAAFTLPNFAPVLNGVIQPAAILEDSGAGAGFLVSSLLAGQVTDLDPGAQQGIAIIGFDSSSGNWEYTIDGSNWNAVTAPSVASALLLAADAQTRLRFVPAANFNGTVASGLTIRAWDRTSGTAGGRADTTSTGGTTAFSSAIGDVNITVSPVNDAPTTAPVTLPAVSEEPVKPVTIGGPPPVSFTPVGPSLTTLPPGTAAPTTFTGSSAAGDAVTSGGSRTPGFILGAQGTATESSGAGLDTAPPVGLSATGRFVLVEPGQSPRSVEFDPTGLQLISMRAEAELVLARFGIDSQSDDARLKEFQSAVRSAAFIGELDRLRESAREDLQLDKSVTISVASVSLGLSVIYILWLIRSGVLLGSYLSALPAWRFLDPLPVLSRVTDEEDDEEEPLDTDNSSPRDNLRGFA